MANLLSISSQRAAAPALFEPPPRNPRRLRSRYITIFAPVREERRPSRTSDLSSSTTSIASRRGDKGSLSLFAHNKLKLATKIARERPALSAISPLSSPENASNDFAPIYDQVSPVEDDNDLLSPVYCMTGQSPQSTRKGAAKPGAFPFPHVDGYSSQASAPRSPQMQFATLKAIKSAGEPTVPETNVVFDKPAVPEKDADPEKPAVPQKDAVIEAQTSTQPERDQAAAGQGARHLDPTEPKPTQQRGPSSKPARRQNDLPSVPPLEIPQKSSRRTSPGTTPTTSADPNLGSPMSPMDLPAKREAAAASSKTTTRRPATLTTPPSRMSRSPNAVEDAAGPNTNLRGALPTPPSAEPKSRAGSRAASRAPSRTDSRAGSRAPSRAPSRADSRAGTRADSRAGARPETRAESMAGSRADSRVGARAESAAGVRADSRVGSRAESRTGARADSRATSRVDSRATSKIDSRATSRVDSSANSRVDAKADVKVDPKADARAASRTRSTLEASASTDASKAIRRKPAPTAHRAESGERSQPQVRKAPLPTTRGASTTGQASTRTRATARAVVVQSDAQPKARAQARAESRAESRAEAQVESQPEAQADAQSEVQAEAEAGEQFSEAQVEARDEARDETPDRQQEEKWDEGHMEDEPLEDDAADDDDEEELSKLMESKAPMRNRPFSTVGPPRPRPRTRAGMRSHIRAKGSLDIGLRPASILFIDKPLPVVNPEQVSLEDRIEHLHAVLSGLGLRRVAINRSIKQMTELMPINGPVREGDILEKRESEKRKLEGLRDELAEVQRLQHELGLKLHRAYKRQERELNFEPTTLWVRRRDVG